MKRALGCCFGLVLSASLGAACDRGGKEGEFCYTSTADSSDCGDTLVCAKCAEGNICVHAEGETRGGLRVPGKQCEKLSSVSESREIKRGAP